MQRGAQPGNQNGVKNRPLTELMRRALLADNGKRARMLAERLIDKAIKGDVSAIKEVLERIDGKVAQAIIGDASAPLQVQILRIGDAK